MVKDLIESTILLRIVGIDCEIHVVENVSWKKPEVGNFQVEKYEVGIFLFELETVVDFTFYDCLFHQLFSNFDKSFPTSLILSKVILSNFS